MITWSKLRSIKYDLYSYLYQHLENGIKNSQKHILVFSLQLLIAIALLRSVSFTTSKSNIIGQSNLLRSSVVGLCVRCHVTRQSHMAVCLYNYSRCYCLANFALSHPVQYKFYRFYRPCDFYIHFLHWFQPLICD